MASVLNRTTKDYRPSVNTPDFDVADWIINPDLTAVVGEPRKYWIITGDVVTLASPAEQTVIDADIAVARDLAGKESEKEEYDAKRVLRAIVELLIDELNVLRTIEGLPDRTIAQTRSAIRNKIDTL